MLRYLVKRWLPWQFDVAAVLLIAAIGSLAYFGDIGPLYKHYSQREQRIARLAEQTAAQEQMQAALKKTRDAASIVKHALDAQHLSLESRGRLNDQITAIYNLAGDCGLLPDSIEPQREASEGMFTVIELRLGGRGSYANCARFLQRLRNEMPNNTVAAIEMSASLGNAEPVVTFGFQLVWHAAPASLASN